MINRKPCPFCLSEDAHFQVERYKDRKGTEKVRGVVVCLDCGAQGPPILTDWGHHAYQLGLKEASNIWNVRARNV